MQGPDAWRMSRRWLGRVPGARDALYLARRIAFRASLGALRLEERFTPPALGPAERLTVILLSYLRPRNIRPIAERILRCSFVGRLVISNNNPTIPLMRYLDGLSSPRLEVVTQPSPSLPMKRFEIARLLPGDYFLAVDDDLVMRSDQVEALFRTLIAAPEAPCGVIGQVFDRGPTGDTARYHLVSRQRQRVDILNRAYLFTATHRDRFFEILDALYARTPELEPLTYGDDLVLSFSGTERPMVHDVGRLLFCPSGDDPAVALWRKPGFQDYRDALYRDLVAVTGVGR